MLVEGKAGHTRLDEHVEKLQDFIAHEHVENDH